MKNWSHLVLNGALFLQKGTIPSHARNFAFDSSTSRLSFKSWKIFHQPRMILSYFLQVSLQPTSLKKVNLRFSNLHLLYIIQFTFFVEKKVNSLVLTFNSINFLGCQSVIKSLNLFTYSAEKSKFFHKNVNLPEKK